MGRYRKIDSRLWNDRKFRSLPDESKLCFLFILTHPHMTGLGAMRASIAGLAEEIGWPVKTFEKAFAKVLAKGMVEAEKEACFLALPKFLRYNPPESPNVVKSWGNTLELLPECKGKTRLIERLKDLLEDLSPSFRKVGKPILFPPFANQEQEQEQEQDDETSSEVSRCSEPSPAHSEPFPVPPELRDLELYASDRMLCRRWQELLEAWREACPGIDVLAEVRKAHAWEVANKDRRKRNRPKFLGNWLARAQDRPRRGKGGSGVSELTQKLLKEGKGDGDVSF